MIYNNIRKARFLDRPNRFIANVDIEGRVEVCHVKNTGRCKELLIPGTVVYVQEFSGTERKTNFDLISVMKQDRLINIDSQVPNKVFHELLKSGCIFKDVTYIKPEAKYKNSRFDFYVETAEDKIFIEVKGVTLEEDNIVMFPDAPTERGVKHITELIECLGEGYKAVIVFVVQMKGVDYFTPNVRTHKEFADILRLARSRGVEVLAFDCNIGQNSIEISERVEVKL